MIDVVQDALKAKESNGRNVDVRNSRWVNARSRDARVNISKEENEFLRFCFYRKCSGYMSPLSAGKLFRLLNAIEEW